MCLASIVMPEIKTPSIIDFSTAPSERSESHPDADKLLTGAPTQVVNNFFSDPTGQFFAGRWESDIGHWRVRYTETEFCYITRGRIRIESESGASWVFGVGSAFVIPAGFVGTWEVLEPVAKSYVIFEPRPSAAH